MSNYTPATADIRNAYVWQRVIADRSVSGTEANWELTRWLNRVRPDPDAAAQVEIVARTLCQQFGLNPEGCSGEWGRCPYKRSHTLSAHAVLTALAEMGGDSDA